MQELYTKKKDYGMYKKWLNEEKKDYTLLGPLPSTSTITLCLLAIVTFGRVAVSSPKSWYSLYEKHGSTLFVPTWNALRYRTNLIINAPKRNLFNLSRGGPWIDEKNQSTND